MPHALNISQPLTWVFYGVFLVFVTYFLILTAYYIFLAIFGIIEGKKKTHEGEEEIYGILNSSTFTMPVSVIIPARNEEEWIEDSVRSVLSSRYPEFEVIIVDDGSTDKTLQILVDLLELEAYDKMYVRKYPDGQVREIFRSAKYPNVTVISNSSGSKRAGAVNSGLNIAKYKYICGMDGDTIMEPDTLLRVMAQVHRDPEKVIGIGSYFGILNGFKIKDGRIIDRKFSYKPIVAYQNLEYIRSFVGTRIAWSRFNAMPNVPGGFGIWRRDIFHELGGYSKDFTCEDVEFTFRVHDYLAKNKDKGYKIKMLPYVSVWTEGPSDVKALIIQRNRWQRVMDETVWKYKYMTFNPKFGSFGSLTLPYFIMYEALGVFFEVGSVFAVLLGAILGILQVNVFLAYISLMILSQAVVSILSIFAFVRSQRGLTLKYVLYLLGLSFVEFFWYRWIVSFAKVAGTVSYLKKDREYTMYQREKRER